MLFFVWLKFDYAQKRIGLTKFVSTSLRRMGFLVLKYRGFRQGRFAAIMWSPHTYIIGPPDAQKRYTQKRYTKAFHSSISGTLFSVVSLFVAITAPELKSVSVVRMCERSRGMKCEDSTMSCDVSVKNKQDIFIFTPFKRGKILR